MSKFDLEGIMKQAQALQEQLARAQAEAADKVVEASAGGGMVHARMNGKLELLELRIDPQVLESGDTEMLQDLIVAAVNQAIRDAQQMMGDQMGKLTGGLRIPGLG